MKKLIIQELKILFPGIQFNISLKNYTTFKIGGLAKYFYIAKSKEDLIKAIIAAKKLGLPFFVLGGGSNLLVADEGYKGIVIKVKSQKPKVKSLSQNSKVIEVEAGVLLSQVVVLALKNNLTGLEWAAGIPGTVGGAVRGNAGAFGGSMADIVKSVETLEILDHKIQNSTPHFFKKVEGKIKNLKNKDCEFGYRESIFKKNHNLIILSVELKLKKGKQKDIQKKIKESLDYRREKHSLNFPSAGSVFKNPKIKITDPKLLERFSEIKEFNKNNLIPAGWLIEKCGLKGKKVGNVQISEKHCNFIVNLRNGKAKEVIKLIKLIKQKVKKKFKIDLEEEIQYLGF